MQLGSFVLALLSLGLASFGNASELGLSGLVLYNAQRISGSGYGTFVSNLHVEAMKRTDRQQVAMASLDISPDGKTTLGMKNGGLVLAFRGETQLLPSAEEMHCAKETLPMLNIKAELQLNAGDSVMIVLPLIPSWTVKPLYITGGLMYEEPTKELIEALIKNLEDPLNVAIIGGIIVSKAKGAQDGADRSDEQEKKDRKPVDLQWASLKEEVKDDDDDPFGAGGQILLIRGPGGQLIPVPIGQGGNLLGHDSPSSLDSSPTSALRDSLSSSGDTDQQNPHQEREQHSRSDRDRQSRGLLTARGRGGLAGPSARGTERTLQRISNLQAITDSEGSSDEESEQDRNCEHKRGQGRGARPTGTPERATRSHVRGGRSGRGRAREGRRASNRRGNSSESE